LPAPTVSVPSSGTGSNFGANLFSFADTSSPAVLENGTGIGNPLNYGVRNLLPAANQMWVGMANNMNLLTTPGEPDGGWELIELIPKAAQ
jgi:hypothetical protein